MVKKIDLSTLFKRFLLFSFVFLIGVENTLAFPVTGKDSQGHVYKVEKSPERVVSLVPSITEMLVGIGVDKSLIGVTYHSTLPSVTTEKVIVGGFAHPSIAKIETLQPDLIFYSSLQKDIVDHFQEKVSLINLQANSIEESFDHIRLLGDIFDQQERAHRIISEQKRLLDLIERKTAHIDNGKKLRVMRLMGQSSVMTPGDDSFQNEYIRRAGGIPPSFG
ncbi:MAG: ABC transporter substrate-binding protein, partial [Desulfobulbaceae bacterium]|nr:ABC transporter substrate-binding protein [Desulfobulbaceae bacterium]